MKLIHIVENLDKGAVENWLVNVFLESRKQRPGWQWTFYCILGREGRLDKKVREAGGKIIYSPCTVSHKRQFLSVLRKTLKEGHYDIIHSHHDYLSGFYLWATRGIKFRKRILQIHNTDEALPVGNKLLHALLLRTFRLSAIRFSDHIIGISNHVLEQFIKGRLSSKKKSGVLYYGIDMTRFGGGNDGTSLKAELNIPAGGKMLLFTGRMNSLKNPLFTLDVLARLIKTDQNYYLVIAGEGDLMEDAKEKAAHLGLNGRVRFLGWREDLAAIMKAADALIFPRMIIPREGLGLVVVEAQCAGLPLFITNGIPEDAIEIPGLANYIDLNNNPGEWADAILQMNAPVNREEVLSIMMRSKFSLPLATQNLIRLYEE